MKSELILALLLITLFNLESLINNNNQIFKLFFDYIDTSYSSSNLVNTKHIPPIKLEIA